VSAEIAGAIISATSVALGWLIGIRTERAAKKQYQLNAISFANSWYTDLRAWASEAIELLCEAAERADDTAQTQERHTEALLVCRYKLSAVIDRGRFFFPNEYHEDFGTNKPAAYRGIRHPALDYLVGAFQILGNEVAIEEFHFKDRKAAIIDLKREFVSVIQVVLNPRLHIQDISRLVEVSRLEKLESESPVGRFLSKRIRIKDKPQF